MAKGSHLDRFLPRRGDRWQYVRRVPAMVADQDKRAPVVRSSLRTHDLAVARVMRDALEQADNDLWASFLCDEDESAALKRHKGANGIRAQFVEQPPSGLLIVLHQSLRRRLAGRNLRNGWRRFLMCGRPTWLKLPSLAQSRRPA